MSEEELDMWIERFRRRFELITEALGDMDEARQREYDELNRRTTTLEYALARLYEEDEKVKLRAENKEIKSRMIAMEQELSLLKAMIRGV